MSIRELDYGNVPKMMAEAREMQVGGRYINGTVFHTLADEIDRLRGIIDNARMAFAETHDSDEARCRAMAAHLSEVDDTYPKQNESLSQDTNKAI